MKFDINATYAPGDTVTYNKVPYECITTTTVGTLPTNTTYWKSIQGNTLVFQPGGTAYGNIYTVWSDVLTAFDNTPGTVTIVLDGSLNSNSVTLDTSHNFQNRVNFISSANYGTSTTILTVNTSAGVQLQGVSEISGGYWICNTTTTSCFTPPTSGYLFMTIKGGAYIYSSSTNNAAIKPTTAGQLILDNGFLGDYNYVGTNPVLNTNGVDMYIICSSGGGFGGYYVFTGAGIIDIFYTDLASYQFSNQASFTGYSGTIYVSQPITTWTGNASYNVNTITSYGGILYKSLISGSNKRPDLNPTYWETISKTHISVDLLASSNVTLSGEQTIDGVLTSASRVFVPYQTSAATRGIYLTGSGAWTRVTDYDTAAKLEASRNIIVKSGTNFSGTTWTLQTPNGITLGSTSLYYSLIKTGSGNVNMALGSLVVSGESNTIEASCTDAAILGGLNNQIKDDPSPGTKLLARGNNASVISSSSTSITGSGISTILANEEGSITKSPGSFIIGGLASTFSLTGNVISGNGIASDFSSFSACNGIMSSRQSSVLGYSSLSNTVISSSGSNIGTAASLVGVIATAAIATVLSNINNSSASLLGGTYSSTLGNNSLSASNYSVILGGSSHLLGTLTAGVTTSAIIGGNTNAIQNAATNCLVGGGSSNLITNVTSAAIVAGTSNTITTTATNSIIGAGSTNTITTALQAGILSGTSNSIASGSTNSAILTGNTNSLGGTAGCTAAVICGGNNNGLSNASNSAAIVAGSTNLIYGGSAPRAFIGAGSSNQVLAADCAILAGVSNAISGSGDSAIIGAGKNNAIGAGCTGAGILAGIGGSAYLHAQIIHSGGYSSGSGVGSVQHSRLILRGSTPGSGTNESSSLLFGVANGNPTQSMTLSDNKSYSIRAIVNITKTGDASISGAIFVDASVYKKAGTVVVLGQNPTSPVALPAGLTGATAVFSGSTTNLVLTVSTGVGNTIATKIGATVEWLENIA